MGYFDKGGSRLYLVSIVLVAVLGGLLFGYDTAVISGAEKGLQAFFMQATDYNHTDAWHGLTCSSALIGCIIGSALSGLLATNFGRKRSLMFAGILFFLSALGSIDANRGDHQNGWDTDQFPINSYELTNAMLQIMRGGGFKDGGTNFDAKLRRNSTDPEDIFIAHISGMDALARALLSAADILEKSELPEMLKERYASFDAGEGKRFEDGQMTLEELVAYAKSHGEPATISGKQEKYEAIVALHVK